MAALHPEYKIILIGDPGVGKTSFFLRIREREFVDTEKRPTASIGVEHLEHTVKIGTTEVKVLVFACSVSVGGKLMTAHTKLLPMLHW